MPEIKTPFAGLYESWLSRALDSAEENALDGQAENDEPHWPEPLQLTANDMADPWFYAMDYTKAHELIAKAYLEEFDAWAGEALGETRLTRVSCGLKFSDMTSPRQYNFETDRLFATCSMAFIKRLWKRSKADEHKTLVALIRERFTSYDGFMSHYANDLDAWPRDLSDWDHNELETLLIACLDLTDADENTLQSQMQDGETFDTIASEAMDWADFERRCMDLRIERLTDWAEQDPAAVALWAAQAPDQWAKLLAHDWDEVAALDLPMGDACGAFYRCPETPDMLNM